MMTNRPRMINRTISKPTRIQFKTQEISSTKCPAKCGRKDIRIIEAAHLVDNVLNELGEDSDFLPEDNLLNLPSPLSSIPSSLDFIKAGKIKISVYEPFNAQRTVALFNQFFPLPDCLFKKWSQGVKIYLPPTTFKSVSGLVVVIRLLHSVSTAY
jgi:hypothetical protein